MHRLDDQKELIRRPFSLPTPILCSEYFDQSFWDRRTSLIKCVDCGEPAVWFLLVGPVWVISEPHTIHLVPNCPVAWARCSALRTHTS